MQGIFRGCEVMAHDVAWTVALDLVQDSDGISSMQAAFNLIAKSGSAGIVTE